MKAKKPKEFVDLRSTRVTEILEQMIDLMAHKYGQSNVNMYWSYLYGDSKAQLAKQWHMSQYSIQAKIRSIEDGMTKTFNKNNLRVLLAMEQMGLDFEVMP